MSKSMMRKGILLLIAVGLVFVAVACKKGNSDTVDYRNYVFKESSSFEISEAEYGYLLKMFPCGEQIAAIYLETIYPDIPEGDGEVYDGTMEDEIQISLPDAMGTPANATEAESEAINSEDAEMQTDLEDPENPEILPETDEYWEYENNIEDYLTIVHIIVYNQDGSVAQSTDINLSGGASVNQVLPDLENSVIYAVVNNFEQWFLKKYDLQGNETASVEISVGDSEFAYVQKLIMTKDGKLVAGMENTIQVFDTEFKLLGEIKSDNYLYSYFCSPSGGVFATADKELPNGEWAQVVIALDLTAFKLGQEYEISLGDYSTFENGSGSYDATVLGSSGIYGWKAGEAEAVKLMGFIESDIDGGTLSEPFLLDENTVVFGKRNKDTWIMEGVVICKKVDPSEIADKETITIGMLYYDYELASKIIEFNSKNENIRIQVKNYRDENGDWESAQKAFNNDLISGNCPDIIFMTETTEQFYNYMEKGTFAPLNDFISADADIDENDIFPNVKAALSSGDKMYAVTSSFYVMSMAMKEKYAPESGRISFEELEALEQKLGVNAFYSTVNEAILFHLLTLGYDEYLDIRTGKCNFSDSFAKALEYTAKYPTEINYDEESFEAYETIYREDKAILSHAFLSNFRDFNRLEQGDFGEKIALVGFPGTEGKGAVLCLNQIYAISAKSKNKEAAWEFIRTFMTSEYQEKVEYNFPVRISAVNKMMEVQMQKEFYIDSEGVRHEYDDFYYSGSQELVLPPISKERAEYLLEYISGVESVTFTNDQISNIITEEAAPFYAGQKNAKQVVEIIQSRVQTYVNEGR